MLISTLPGWRGRALRLSLAVWIAASGAMLLYSPLWLNLRWLAAALWLNLLCAWLRELAPAGRLPADGPAPPPHSAPWCERMLESGLWAVDLPEPESGPGGGRQVLAALADPAEGRRLRQALAGAGYRCTLVRNGIQALQRLCQQEFDAALLATELPLMGGLEVMRAYRFMRGAEPAAPAFLLLSDKGRAHRAERQAGAAVILQAPLDAAALLEQLERLAQTMAAFPVHFPYATTAPEPVLDLSVLAELESIGRDPEFLDSLLAATIADNRQLVARLEQALRQADFADCREILHALRGSALSLGALALKATCLRYERMTAAEMGRAAQELQGAIPAELERLEQALEQYLDQRRRRG